ncbi:hypothetical protein [Bacillus halotolerans]|uniref:Uncharacterized protein n=1 Tax=Bacillus halotolerans TaxID=260554 RepID=A0A9Q4ENA2_9BACI|nr:hypothetical protein [Bacillus halotolerans]MCY9186530.1 hypothetical protein [Bacillus halotolerans]
MKKKIRKITSISLGVATVSSIALALHFNSLSEDYKESHIKLNAKYKDVLVENEELRDTVIKLKDKNTVLKDEAKKSSGLLEQSKMEIEKLNGETTKLRKQVDQQKEKVKDLEKK